MEAHFLTAPVRARLVPGERPKTRRDRRAAAAEQRRTRAKSARAAKAHRRSSPQPTVPRRQQEGPGTDGPSERGAACVASRCPLKTEGSSHLDAHTRRLRSHRGPPAARRRARHLVGMVFAATLAGAITSVALPDDAAAQQRRRTRLKPQDLTLKGSVAARPLVLVGALAVLTLLPFVIIMVTSFVKISVVLSIVRSAIGTQQIPPTQVITGIAIILTVYIMAPVGLEIYKTTESTIQQRRPGASLVSAETVDLIFEAVSQARGPMKDFLAKNSHVKDRAMFFSMAKRLRKPEDRSGVGPDDLMVLVPSFVISELKEAFQIGFIIFVPFLVIDMIVANILMALGMQMLSPTTISLPFKLLLFVMIDGWYLITKGLITGYI